MKNRIFLVVLASLLVAGMVGTAVFATDDTPGIVLPDDSFTTSSADTDPEEPVEPDYAKAIVFKADSGFTASTYTGYIGGADFDTTVEELKDALENEVGVDIVRDLDSIESNPDRLHYGDKLVLKHGDGPVIEGTELEIIFMGNADKNNKLNLADVSSMLKKIAKWDVTIDEVASDVDGNGTVNLTDVSTVLKKIAKWDVEFVKVPVLPGKYTMVNKGDVPCNSAPAGTGWTALCLSDGIHYDLGVKFNVKADEFATQISFLCPSWADNKGRLTISVYKWNGDYNTSIAAMPIISETFIDYEDNSTLFLDLTDTSGKGLMEGEYVWRIHDGADAGEGTGVGIWYFPEMGPTEDSGMKTFLNCEEFNIGPVSHIFYATAK